MDNSVEKTACDLFGGRATLAKKIVDCLSNNSPFIQRLIEECDPIVVLKKLSRQELLDELFERGVSLEFLELTCSEDDKAYWRERFNLPQSDPSQELAFDISLRLEALSELCGRDVEPILTESQRLWLRKKYKI